MGRGDKKTKRGKRKSLMNCVQKYFAGFEEQMKKKNLKQESLKIAKRVI